MNYIYQNGNNIKFPNGWLMISDSSQSKYAYDQLTFTEYSFAKLIKVEDYQGKVKSITFLKSLDTMYNTIAEEAVLEILEEYGIYDSEKVGKFEDKVNMKKIRLEDAVMFLGVFQGQDEYYVSAWRSSRNIGYVPYEYQNSEYGDYIEITIK